MSKKEYFGAGLGVFIGGELEEGPKTVEVGSTHKLLYAQQADAYGVFGHVSPEYPKEFAIVPIRRPSLVLARPTPSRGREHARARGERHRERARKRGSAEREREKARERVCVFMSTH